MPAAMRWVLFLLCGCASLLAARLAYAETLFRRDTPPEMRQALWLDRAAPPTQYFERLGRFDDASRHNPRSSSSWIALGLDAERQGRAAEAEHDLLEAARVDRQYLPSWTLANYYFRRHDSRSFWHWARRAAGLAYDDLTPLLQLANALEPDALAAMHELGDSDGLVRADLGYLTGAGRFDSAQQVVRLLLARLSPANRRLIEPSLMEMTDRQIQAGNAAYAVEIWNRLFPAADSRDLLTNDAFQQAPGGLGFDWRLPSTEGVAVQWEPAHLIFSFSGTQAESCALLEQIVALAPPARRYRLSFEYLTAEIPSPTGVHWELEGQDTPSLQPSSGWRRGDAVLTRPRGGLSRLRLIYQREPGTVRAQGRLEVRHVSMEPLL